MARYLVVAHQTAASLELITKLKELQLADEQAEFTLLVPATPTSHLLTWLEGEAEQVAQRRASESIATLRKAGLSVTNTIIGDADPLKAIDREVRYGGREYDMTVISMLPPGLSRWLRRDLAHKLQSLLGERVVTVFAGQMVPGSHGFEEASWPEEPGAGEPPTLHQLADRLGQQVFCLDGDIGQMHEILYDYVVGMPMWIGLFAHPVSIRMLLVPAKAVRVSANGLRVPMSRRQIIGQPPVSVGEGFSSLSEEESLYRYFGLPFDDLRDTRVLRIGQEFPGLERNEQHILASDEMTPGGIYRP